MAADGAKRIDVRAPGSEEIVALAYAATRAELEIKAEHCAGLARPVLHCSLLCVERLRRAREAAMQRDANARALTGGAHDTPDLALRPCGALIIRRPHVEPHHRALRHDVHRAAAIDGADIERDAFALS